MADIDSNRRGRTALVVAVVVVIAIAIPYIWWIWENRGSDKFLAAAVTVIAVPIAYSLADRLPHEWMRKALTPFVLAVGATVVAFFFTEPAESNRVLQARFLMNGLDMTPVEMTGILPNPLEASVLIPALARDKWSADGDGGMTVYHHLLQRAILQTLVQNPEWATERYRTNSGFGASYERFQIRSGEQTAEIPVDEIKAIFSQNRFIAAPFPGNALHVPAGMKLAGSVASADRAGIIALANRYFELNIETRTRSSERFLLGPYARLSTGGATQDPRYWSVTYEVLVKGKARSPRRHNPEIPKLIDWTQRITDRLAGTFDEQERWKVAMQQLTLRHFFPQQ
jgi:hypothetical protein